MNIIRNIKGSKDLLPNDTIQWQKVENLIHDFTQKFGYKEIRTPIFEESILFERGIGTETDIVNKEMYSWLDQGKKSLTLRPELTAPVARAYIQHELGKKNPINKLYYLGALFRRERPQKGRQRQFHQFGVEVFGSVFPEQDAEVILMAYSLLQSLGLNEICLQINTIGSQNNRSEYTTALQNLLSEYRNHLSSLDQKRLDTNPLRLFDSKDPKCIELLDDKAPTIYDYISKEDKNHFLSVCTILDNLSIPYIHDEKLVRGLDYYTHTTFEITSEALGSQDALCGGGRYDGLVEQLGGPSTPAVGFAAGMERIIMALDQEASIPSIDIFIILMGEPAIQFGMKIANTLRIEGDLSVVTETLQRSLRAQMREANRLGAKHCIIIGQDEIDNSAFTIKNMAEGTQTNISKDDIINYFINP